MKIIFYILTIPCRIFLTGLFVLFIPIACVAPIEEDIWEELYRIFESIWRINK
jgi:uncharacterized membrane protein YvlD (DUF360 family)